MILAGCNWQQREARRMVARAVALSDTAPDSTVILIDSVLRMPIYFSERGRMDMALLQAEALFGEHGQEISPIMDDDFFDGHANISTSPELERAAAYYARKKQYGKAAHAALYSGFVQQHYDEKDAAVRSFKEAEQYGKMVDDSLTVAQAEYKMGSLLYNDGLENEAQDMFRNSKRFIGNHHIERAYIENSEAVTYILMGQHDNADSCLQRGMILAEKWHSDKVIRKILNNYSVLYRLQGKYDQAVDCLHRMMAQKNLSENDMFVLNLNLGNVYFDMKEMDSAARYYQFVELVLPKVNVKKETVLAAYEALYRFAEDQIDDSLALQYREMHEKGLYDLMVLRQKQTIYRIQQQYDYENLQNEMNKKIISRHRIILIISALLLVTTIVILFLQYKQKRLKEAEAELKSQIDAMKQDLRQTVKSSVMEKEIALRLRIMLTANHVKKKTKDPNNEWGTLVWQVMNGKDNLFDAAQATIETVYPDLYAIITESHPDLTKTEARLCLLSFTDLSNTEMAEILGLSLNTVNQNRSNLRKKLNLNSDKLKDQLRMTLSK